MEKERKRKGFAIGLACLFAFGLLYAPECFAAAGVLMTVKGRVNLISHGAASSAKTGLRLKSGDILDNAVEEGIVDKRGAFYSYGEQRLAQGRENAKTFLEANPELMYTIENQVREAKGLPWLEPSAFAEALNQPEVAEALAEMEQAEL